MGTTDWGEVDEYVGHPGGVRQVWDRTAMASQRDATRAQKGTNEGNYDTPDRRCGLGHRSQLHLSHSGGF
jgi:hypothetical protein